MTVGTPLATADKNFPASWAACLLLGQVSTAFGAFWLVMSLTVAVDGHVFAGAALTAGGLVLLLWRRLRLSGRVVAAGVLVTGTAGTAAGLAARTTDMGGMYGWFEDRGWPFAWLGRGAVADSPDEAYRQAVTDGWATDPLRLLADVTVWAYTGMALTVMIVLAWRGARLLARFAPDRPERAR